MINLPLGFSQSTAVELKEKADKYYNKEKYAKAVDYYIKAMNIEEAKDIPDEVLLGKCYQSLAYCSYEINSLEYVPILCETALKYFRSAGDYASIYALIPWMSTYYKYSILEDYPFKLNDDELKINRRMSFRIETIEEDHGDSVIAILGAGKYDGIFDNSIGTAYGSYSEIYSDRENLELGKVEVLEVIMNHTRVKIRLKNPEEGISRVYEGDMVELPAKLPKLDYNGEIYELAIRNIDFLDMNEIPIYHIRHIIRYDSPELEKDIIRIMKKDIRETAEWLRESLESHPEWSMPYDSGRYTGKSLVEIMENVSNEDVYAFMQFVKCFPGKYMGHSWKINETFATWVFNYAPVSSYELRDWLLNAEDEEFSNLVQLHRKDIYDNSFLSDWVSEANDFSDKADFDKAYELNAMVIKVANLLKDDVNFGWALFNKAEILSDNIKYRLALEMYTQALNYFVRSNDTTGISYCYNNIALQYMNLDDYENSLLYYSKAMEVKQVQLRKNPSESLYTSTAISLLGLGEAYYFKGEYTKALEYFSQAFDMNDLANSEEGRNANAGLYYWIAKVYEKLGNKEEALNYFYRQYNYYLANGNLSKQATALDNIAYNTDNTKEALDLYQRAYDIKISLGLKNDAGFSLSNVGQMYWTLGEYDKAIEAHNLALSLKRESGNKAGQAYSLSKLAALYKDSGEPQKAIDLYKESLSIYQELGEKKEVADIYADIAETYNIVKDHSQANQYYKKSIEVSKLIGDQYNYAYNLFELGNSYYDERKYNEAKKCYEESLDIRKEIGDKSGQVYNLINIGLIERIANYKLELAENYFRQAMQMAYETNSDENIAYCKRSLGHLYYNSGQYDSSLYYYETALAKYKSLEDKSTEASTLINIGFTYESMGEFETAESYFNESFKLAEQGYDRINMSSALSAISDLKRRYGDYPASLEIENKSFEISKDAENLWGVAGSYLNMGNIYNVMGEYKTAIRYYEKGDSIYKTISGPESSATPINNIGVIYFSMGDFDKALKYFKNALHLVETTYQDKDFMSLINANIGEIYYYKKMYDSAHIYLDKSLKMCTETGNVSYQASTRLIMARLYLEEDNLPQALENLEATSQLLFGSNEKGALAELHILFGRYFIKKANFKQAKNHLDNGISIVRTMGTKKILWEPLYLLSDIYRNQGMIDSAIVTLEESIETLEYLKNKIIGGEEAVKLFTSVDIVSKVYELMVQMLMEKGDIEGALKYLEKGNNESLRSKFRNMNVAFADSTKNQYISTDKEYKTKIETLNQEIEKEKAKPQVEQSAELIIKLEQIKTITQNDYRNFINDVVQQEPSLRNYFTMSENPMDFKAQKRNIPNDMAVLLYLLSEKNLYIFVGTSDSVFAKVIDVDKKEVEQQIVDLYNMIKTPSFTGAIDVSVRGANVVAHEDGQNTIRKDYFIQLSSELYNLLIAPVEEELSTKQRLAIIPNGMLYYLPFQILIKQGKDDKYSYLVSKYSIFYTNRLSYLTNVFYPDENCPDMLAIGNADNSLPYAEVEVKTIEKIFDNAIVLIEDQATRKNVFGNTSCYNILHFATHGVLDYNDYDNSFIVLAADPESGDDGKLRIDEVFGLRSIENCKLVTLSACETAVPMELMEGWPITTASAFLQAGVPSVIASLWSVDDKATSILMGKFYANLKTMETVDALHKAQVDMAMDEKYNHPYFWAPFLLVGSWK